MTGGNEQDRTSRWIADLRVTLDRAASLVARGRDMFDSDPALPLAFEALLNRVGELAKRLSAADPVRFADRIWSDAARNRDFVVHHYDRIDLDTLWVTVARDLPALRRALDTVTWVDAARGRAPRTDRVIDTGGLLDDVRDELGS